MGAAAPLRMGLDARLQSAAGAGFSGCRPTPAALHRGSGFGAQSKCTASAGVAKASELLSQRAHGRGGMCVRATGSETRRRHGQRWGRGRLACRAEEPLTEEERKDPQWELSEREYPQGEVVLGMEIRSHSVKGSLVDTANGEFIRPGVVALIDEPTPTALLEAVRKVRKHQDWAGPVGCSVTKAVWRLLGSKQANAALREALPECKGEVAVMNHTQAAAMAALSFKSETNDPATWPQPVVVCTVGMSLGIAMYQDGAQVEKNLTQLTWTWTNALKRLQRKWGFISTSPPFPEGGMAEVLPEGLDELDQTRAAFAAWLALLAPYFDKVVERLQPGLLLVVPTGPLAEVDPSDLQVALRVRCNSETAERMVVSDRPGGMCVKGAARLALQEQIYAMRAERRMVGAIGKFYGVNRHSMVTMDEAQIADLHAHLDADMDGHVTLADLAAGCSALDLKFNAEEAAGLFARLTMDNTNPLTPQLTQAQLHAWCTRMYSDASVQAVNSTTQFLHAMQDDRFQLKVVKVANLSCRACKKFEKSFEDLAIKHPQVRFVTVNLDQNESTQRLTGILDIAGTPTFLYYDGDKEVARLKGSNIIKFMSGLDDLLARPVALPPDVDAAAEQLANVNHPIALQ